MILAEWLKALYRGWLKVAHFIGKVNTTLLLTLFYFTFLGVAKFVTLLGGRDLLDSRWRDRQSYWKKRKNFQIKRESFLKPY